MVLLLIIAQFSVGETLFYRVKYGPFTAGTLTLSVEEPAIIQGETCYHFTSILRYRFLFFSGEDRLDSYSRTEDLTTLRFEKHISESGHSEDVICDFDYGKGKIIYSDGVEFDIEPRTKDILTLWYYFRSLNLKRGDTIWVVNHTDKETYHLRIGVREEKSVKTPLGEFACFLVSPAVEGKGSFGKEGKLLVYLSKDKRRLPLIIKTKMLLGYITAELYKICSTL